MAGETPAMKTLLKDSARGEAENADWFALGGVPLVKITCAASELVNTGNYSNITLGPISVSRFVQDGDDEHLAKEISRTQSLCEAAIAEERQTVVTMLRANASAQAK